MESRLGACTAQLEAAAEAAPVPPQKPVALQLRKQPGAPAPAWPQGHPCAPQQPEPVVVPAAPAPAAAPEEVPKRAADPLRPTFPLPEAGCLCDVTGAVNGVATAQPGCARHL